MNAYSEVKHISIEDFKKIDINKILYVQLDTGEKLMIDHSYNKYNNYENKKGNKTKNDYTLPQDYFKETNDNYLNKSKSSKRINKSLNLIKDFKSLNDFSIRQRLKFFDKIPKRAKYWENESFDSSRTYFQEKRLKKQNKKYNLYYINNYKPLPKENENVEEYNNNENYYNYNNINYNNVNQLNQLMNSNYLYQIALGPFFPQYSTSQQSKNETEYQYAQNQKNDFSNEKYDYNYDPEQMVHYYYNDYFNYT